MPRPYFKSTPCGKAPPAWQLPVIVLLAALSLLFLFSGCEEARAQTAPGVRGKAVPDASARPVSLNVQGRPVPVSAPVVLDIPALVPGRPVASRARIRRASAQLRRTREDGGKPFLVLRLAVGPRFPAGRAPTTSEERVLRAFLPELLGMARRAGARGVLLPSANLRREARRLVDGAGIRLVIG